MTGRFLSSFPKVNLTAAVETDLERVFLLITRNTSIRGGVVIEKTDFITDYAKKMESRLGFIAKAIAEVFLRKFPKATFQDYKRCVPQFL